MAEDNSDLQIEGKLTPTWHIQYLFCQHDLERPVWTDPNCGYKCEGWYQ